MAGTAFSLDARGFKEVQKYLAQLSDLQIIEMEKSLGESLQEVSREHIDKRTTPEGEPMAEWSEKYSKRAAKDPRRDILRGPDERLRSSITWQVRTDGLYYGSAMVYAGVHQFGWDEKNIPARPYLGIGDEEHTIIEDTLESFMENL